MNDLRLGLVTADTSLRECLPSSSSQGYKSVVFMSSEGLLTDVKTHVQRSVIYRKRKRVFLQIQHFYQGQNLVVFFYFSSYVTFIDYFFFKKAQYAQTQAHPNPTCHQVANTTLAFKAIRGLGLAISVVYRDAGPSVNECEHRKLLSKVFIAFIRGLCFFFFFLFPIELYIPQGDENFTNGRLLCFTLRCPCYSSQRDNAASMMTAGGAPSLQCFKAICYFLFNIITKHLYF